MRRVLQEKKKDFLCVVKPTKNLRFCKVMSLTGEKEQASYFRKITMYPSTTPWSPPFRTREALWLKNATKTVAASHRPANGFGTSSRNRPDLSDAVQSTIVGATIGRP